MSVCEPCRLREPLPGAGRTTRTPNCPGRVKERCRNSCHRLDSASQPGLPASVLLTVMAMTSSMVQFEFFGIVWGINLQLLSRGYISVLCIFLCSEAQSKSLQDNFTDGLATLDDRVGALQVGGVDYTKVFTQG